MLSVTRCLPVLLPTLLAPLMARAHESLLPSHHHTTAHVHELPRSGASPVPRGKFVAEPFAPASTAERFSFTAGTRLTRYSIDGSAAHLWEASASLGYAVLPWLQVGVDASYGWFQSGRAKADGVLPPHAHLDLHLPLGGPWELVAGLDVVFPGADAAVAPDDWGWVPHAEFRYDRGTWYLEAGVSAAFTVPEKEGGGAVAEAGAIDIPGVIGPEGERELQYYASAGISLLERRLTLASRIFGERNLSGDTPEKNYVRTGLEVSWEATGRIGINAEGSVPITEAARNEWQASLGLSIGC